ncbi:MAG: Gldg family protein [Chloroflexota bacterium]|nr:Gldg family protein [Chloroflexota bacterium]
MAEQDLQRVSFWERTKGILSAAALLLAIIGAVALLGGFALWLWTEDLRNTGQYLMIAGGVILVVAALFSTVNIREALSGQRGRFAINAILMIVAFTGIIVFANFISYNNVARADLTASKQFSLSLQTVQVLEDLVEDVHATAFFVPGIAAHETNRQLADDLLFEFERRSSQRFSYEFVDPEADPSRAELYGLSEFPSIVFQSRRSGNAVVLTVPPLSEQDLTSMMLIVTGTQQKKVYFVTGHGEKDSINPDPQDGRGFALAARGVLADSYAADTLNLAQAGVVPPDAAVLVFASPSRNMSLQEYDAFDAWLRAGGRAIFLVDAPVPNSIRTMLEPWGIGLGDQTIVDANSSLFGDERSPLIQSGQFNRATTITNDLDTILFTRATPIEITVEPEKLPPWVEYIPLATTSFLSWSTSDPERNEFNPEAGDRIGPHALGVVVHACGVVGEEIDTVISIDGRSRECISEEGTRKPTTIAIFADSDFAANRYAAYSTNLDFFLNTVNYVAEDYNLISIRPKPFAFRELVVTRQEFDFIRFASWFLLPAAVGLASIAVWWRRR